MAGEEARVTAALADLTYDEMIGRVVAVQADTTHTLKTGRVTAVKAVATVTTTGTALGDPGARVHAVHAVVTRPIHHKSVYAAPINKTSTHAAPINATLTYNAPLDPETLDKIESPPRGGDKEPMEE